MVRRMLQLQEWWHVDQASSPSEEDANERYRSLMIKLAAQVPLLAGIIITKTGP